MANGQTEQNFNRPTVAPELREQAEGRLYVVDFSVLRNLAENPDVKEGEQRDPAQVNLHSSPVIESQAVVKEDFHPRLGTVTELQRAVDMNAIPSQTTDQQIVDITNLRAA